VPPMPATFQAIAVIAFAVLPGAAFVFAMERAVGAWGVKAADRLLRFISLSALLYVGLVPYSYWLFRKYVLSGHLANARAFPWVPYLILVACLGVLPWVIGTFLGRAIRNNVEWVARLFGQLAAYPRAWDYTFRKGQTGYVRILVKGDKPKWVAGTFTNEGGGRRAYTAVYPEDSDIYLPVRVKCDEKSGEFEVDETGEPILMGKVSILVCSSEIAYLEFIPG
jgi:hypothetical protein